jgi:hypothetical protein
MNSDQFSKLTAGVISVGSRRGRGRGFVVSSPNHSYGSRLVITAAYCLPHLPPPNRAAYAEEFTYAKVLGPLDKPLSVWAECLFVDPRNDLAVLGAPDGQDLWDQVIEYENLVTSGGSLKIQDAPKTAFFSRKLTRSKSREEAKAMDDNARANAWLLSLKNEWFRCEFKIINDGPIWIMDMDCPIVGGMSGSPIVSDSGAAIGAICLDNNNPRLCRDLPGWLLPNRRR